MYGIRCIYKPRCVHIPCGREQPKSLIISERITKWHWKLSHCGFQQVQALIHIGVNSTSILIRTHQTISSCTPTLCASCKIACMNCRTPTPSQTFGDPDQFMAIRQNNLKIGQTIGMDHPC